MEDNPIYNFSIPGFTTQRQWSVYVVIAVSTKKTNGIKNFYVGKVGDNSDGCNPIITRIGNHLSHYTEHSQLRNELELTADYNYHVYFATFGNYTGKDRNLLDKVNQLERELNKIVQKKIEVREDCRLINPLKGTYYINRQEKEKRERLLSEVERMRLDELAEAAIKHVQNLYI